MKLALLHAALIGTGGFIGALARYGLTGLVQRFFPMAVFPYGTMAVNLIGCFLIGAMGGLADSRQILGPEFRMFALIGLLGGFTTFSTFGYETFVLVQEAEYLRAAANAGAHVLLGLALVWVGFMATTIEAG